MSNCWNFKIIFEINLIIILILKIQHFVTRYLGPESDALIAISKALKARSLKDFENAKIAHDKVDAKFDEHNFWSEKGANTIKNHNESQENRVEFT